MKTIILNLYEFDELSIKAQERVINRERWNIMEQCMDCYGMDYQESLKGFDMLMGTKACDYNVGYSGYDFDYRIDDAPIYENPVDTDKDIYPGDLRGRLLFRYINNNIMPRITKGKYIHGRNGRHRYSKVILEYKDNCPLTGTCCDLHVLKPIIDYYESWSAYPDGFSLEDLIELCYDSLFKSWHEEYGYIADNEATIREELHNNQYESLLYHENGDEYGYDN